MTVQLADVRDRVRAPIDVSTSRFNDELHESLVAKAKGVRPLLERHAAEHERKGSISGEVIAALDDIGAFKLSAPRRWGGLCASAYTMTCVSAELAKGCPSTAWVASIINSAVFQACKGGPDFEEAVFGNGLTRVCAPGNGQGTLVPEGDKYRLNGRWGYASASHHSEWAMSPATTPDGAAHFVAMRLSDLRIENTWKVAGMKGSGSDTIVAENILIPREQFFPVGYLNDAGRFYQEPTDYWMMISLLRIKAMGVLLGAVEGLLEAVMAGRERPIIYTFFEKRMLSSTFQAGIGEQAAKIIVARSIIERLAKRMDSAAVERRAVTFVERTQAGGETAVATTMLIETAEKLMSLAGSSAFTESSPAQRYWRDFSIAVRHFIFNKDVSYETFGRQLLGIEGTIVDPNMV